MPSQFLKAIGKRVEPTTGRHSLGGAHQDDNAANGPRLLRMCGDRPYSCPTTEQPDELAPPHSITSSAVASNVEESSSASAFAVLRLITRSNFVDWYTGILAGFSPFKIRPV